MHLYIGEPCSLLPMLGLGHVYQVPRTMPCIDYDYQIVLLPLSVDAA